MLATELTQALEYLAVTLEDGELVELVLIGGGSLALLGLIDRATKDLDVAALLEEGVLRTAEHLPPRVQQGVRVVARALDLAPDWLNSGPASILDSGLPPGFMARAHRRDFGTGLTVHLAARVDQVFLKTYAAADYWPARANKHLDDLRVLAPTVSELERAATWCRTHDPSEGFLVHQLRPILAVFDAD